MTDQAPDLLTVHEVAAALRVDPATIRRWTANGTLRGVRLGRVVRIRRDELDDFLRRSSGQ